MVNVRISWLLLQSIANPSISWKMILFSIDFWALSKQVIKIWWKFSNFAIIKYSVVWALSIVRVHWHLRFLLRVFLRKWFRFTWGNTNTGQKETHLRFAQKLNDCNLLHGSTEHIFTVQMIYINRCNRIFIWHCVCIPRRLLAVIHAQNK